MLQKSLNKKQLLQLKHLNIFIVLSAFSDLPSMSLLLHHISSIDDSNFVTVNNGTANLYM